MSLFDCRRAAKYAFREGDFRNLKKYLERFIKILDSVSRPLDLSFSFSVWMDEVFNAYALSLILEMDFEEAREEILKYDYLFRFPARPSRYLNPSAAVVHVIWNEASLHRQDFLREAFDRSAPWIGKKYGEEILGKLRARLGFNASLDQE